MSQRSTSAVIWTKSCNASVTFSSVQEPTLYSCVFPAGHGGAYLSFQHLGDRGRRVTEFKASPSYSEVTSVGGIFGGRYMRKMH